jgi:hypothetical protein
MLVRLEHVIDRFHQSIEAGLLQLSLPVFVLADRAG